MVETHVQVLHNGTIKSFGMFLVLTSEGVKTEIGLFWLKSIVQIPEWSEVTHEHAYDCSRERERNYDVVSYLENGTLRSNITFMVRPHVHVH